MVGVESLTGSLVAGVLILATLVAVVAYGWLREERAHRESAHRESAHRGTEGPPLKKAA
jgi:CHASE3 domain sensor protein